MGGAETRATYLDFREVFPVPSRHTRIYDVVVKSSGVRLGQIRWYAQWRRYALYPNSFTVFEKQCLEQIVAFIEQLMASRREGKRR